MIMGGFSQDNLPSSVHQILFVLDTNVLISDLAYVKSLYDVKFIGEIKVSCLAESTCLGLCDHHFFLELTLINIPLSTQIVLIVPWIVLCELDGLKTGHTSLDRCEMNENFLLDFE
jgi:hypothetical protein